jgi:hypothetical protein
MDPKPETDLSEWPSVDEAAVALKTSRRSVLRANERGELEIRKRSRAGKKPENVVNPDDLQKLIDRAAPRPFPVGVSRLPVVGTESTPAPEPGPAALDRFIEAIQGLSNAPRLLPAPINVTVAAPPQEPTVPLHLKLNLTLEESAVYSGYSALKLRQAIAAGRLEARKDGPHGAIIIKRASLESL